MYQNQNTNINYPPEPEYLIRPTFKLAWGLWWRMIIIQLAVMVPFVILFGVIGSK